MIPSGQLIDSRERVLRDLRISVTDRCNFRCIYCLPETEAAEGFYRNRWNGGGDLDSIRRQWQPRELILQFEEIERVARLAVAMGVRKIRLTGGETLLRQELENLVERLAHIPGLEDLALTTNGFSFLEKGKLLRQAGLHRVSFSLDSLDRKNFEQVTGRDALDRVLASIDFAQELGLSPVKINAVIIRGRNDHEIEALAEFGRVRGLTVRFIEFMPLDLTRAWSMDSVVPGREILRRLQTTYRLHQVPPVHPADTAQRWAWPEGPGEIGIIASVTEPFCGQCNRLRITADGMVRTCLFSTTEHNLRALLRGGASDKEVCTWLQEKVWHKEPSHQIGREDYVPSPRSMSCIGG
jgi:cyclic pyranopterin phosphate synthase